LRKEYQLESLLESTVDPDPYRQFQVWFDQAVAAELPEPNAMTLATATSDGIPSARIVLLKGVDPQGFVFFTNYTSQKGQELAANPRAAIVFLWIELERQVRIQGSIVKVPDAESDAYFRSRPLGSQLGAWVSEQSQVIADRESLEQRLAALQQQYADQTIPRPPHWGGYRLQPTNLEFWQGRRNRLHDRLCYRLAQGEWVIERLAP
jgi:pyridoxamine 5'-phosphate oxidase